MQKRVFEVELPMMIIKEADQYVAYTPALELCTSGKTVEEAQKNFGEILSIFFEEVSEKGTLDEVLEDFGWQQAGGEWIPPEVVSHAMQPVEMPFSVS